MNYLLGPLIHCSFEVLVISPFILTVLKYIKTISLSVVHFAKISPHFVFCHFTLIVVFFSREKHLKFLYSKILKYLQNHNNPLETFAFKH